MKTIRILTAFVCALIFTSCHGQSNNQILTPDQTITKIEVIDFHATHRCMTCNAIESNTKYTLDTYFSTELDEGKITFQTINVDKKENQKIAEKFEVYGTALFLNVIKNGNEDKINLTDFAFLNGNNKKDFSEKLKAKIEHELKTL